MTTTSILITLGVLFTHWIADFVFQTDAQAKGKSKEWKHLLDHTLTYSSVMWVFVVIVFSFKGDPIWYINALYFFVVTIITHTITDYFTSRVNAKLWAEGKVHNFFVSVGFDQFLHFAQLLITYYLLSRP